MKVNQILPFMRFVGFCRSLFKRYDEMIGYECRMFYIINGSGELIIQKEPHLLNKGDLVIINSGVPYQIMFPQGAVTYYLIKFDCSQDHSDISSESPGDRPIDFDPQKIMYHMDFEDAPQFNEYLILHDMNQTERLFHLIFKEERKRLIGWQMVANGILAEIFGICLRAGSGYSDKSKLNDVLNYLHASYNSRETNAEIAAKFGYHPNYLSTLFVKITGKTMHQYLLSLRVSHAAELLNTTNASITQVATMCGFENSSRFSAIFKKEFGKTPLQYRKDRHSK